jgi:hypothetical protein
MTPTSPVSLSGRGFFVAASYTASGFGRPFRLRRQLIKDALFALFQ